MAPLVRVTHDRAALVTRRSSATDRRALQLDPRHLGGGDHEAPAARSLRSYHAVADQLTDTIARDANVPPGIVRAEPLGFGFAHLRLGVSRAGNAAKGGRKVGRLTRW